MIRHPSSRSHRGALLHLGGREPLADGFARRLDDDWHWFRRVAVGGGDPIDAVIVGPGGTWTLTTSGERGRFARRNGHWYRWNRSTDSWVPWEPQPITTARLAARRLALYLERAGLRGEVRAVLVPPGEMSVEATPGEPIGILVEREVDRIAPHVTAEPVLSQQQVDRIVALLDPRQPLPRLAPSTHGG